MRQTRSVWVATPYGRDGMGGIDRLNDAIFDFVGHHPELDTRLTRLVTRGKRGLLNAQFVFAYALARFAVAAVRGKVDLLHIHISGHGSSYRKAVLGMLAHRLGIPYVVHLHGVNYREFWAGTNPPLRHALDQLYRRSMGNIVLGNFWAGVILERLPETKSTIIVLPNATSVAVGVDRRRTENNGRLRVTFLGQLGSRKGTPLLIEALTRLRHRDNWIATVAGVGR